MRAAIAAERCPGGRRLAAGTGASLIRGVVVDRGPGRRTPSILHRSGTVNMGRDAMRGVKSAVDKTAENGNSTLQAIIGAYLESRKRELDAGGLSATSYASDVYRLEQFKQHCERERKTKLADIVTADFLGAYRSKLLEAIAKGKASAVSVKHLLRTVKACFKWGYKQEKIDVLPRVLEDYAKVALPQPTPLFGDNYSFP